MENVASHNICKIILISINYPVPERNFIPITFRKLFMNFKKVKLHCVTMFLNINQL